MCVCVCACLCVYVCERPCAHFCLLTHAAIHIPPPHTRTRVCPLHTHTDRQEIAKWVGSSLLVFSVEASGKEAVGKIFTSFACARGRSVLIVSYETLRANTDKLPPIGLLVCDEVSVCGL